MGGVDRSVGEGWSRRVWCWGGARILVGGGAWGERFGGMWRVEGGGEGGREGGVMMGLGDGIMGLLYSLLAGVRILPLTHRYQT